MSMAQLTEEEVQLGDLLLDPNNYRFHADEDYVRADDARVHEDTVQDRTYARLRREDLATLKNSIMTNGFLPFERLVVRRYASAEDKYVVLEGNRRVAALRWIKGDDEAGVSIPKELLEILGRIPVIVVDNPEDDPTLELSLMGVRHVGGIREWGAYQRAQLVTELRDRHQLDTSIIATRLGMTAHEVNRRYRAFRALIQMEGDEEYGDFSSPEMYPLFHEAITGTNIKEWLGWSDVEARFENEETLHQFYDLITPTDNEDGTSREPRLANREAVRQLRAIIDVPEAKRKLLDPDGNFHEALAIAKADELSKTWVAQVGEAVTALRSVSAVELAQLGDEDLAEVVTVRDAAANLLDLHSRLTA
jgi:hypothetical protein